MPLVKFDYVVSFSSEDSEHRATNLLNSEIGKNYWLSGPGETSASVMLQLPRAVKISAVNVGVYHTALVEILVGRSETPNEPFQVLVPSCIVISASESRQKEGLKRVRTFTTDSLEEGASRARWDRIRVVCTQPYNKHSKFGLVFIHVFEGEDLKCEDSSLLIDAKQISGATKMNESGDSSQNSLKIPTASSSDEEDFKPGQLFSEYLNSSKKESQSIRQATAQVLKNKDDANTKLVRTSLGHESPTTLKDRKINSEDSNTPSSHKHKEDKKRPWTDFEPDKKVKNKVDMSVKESTLRNRNSRASGDTDKGDQENTSAKCDTKKNKNDHHTPTRKKPKKHDNAESLRAGPITDKPHEILDGVVFALSGYENPRRSDLRNAGLALGAKYEREYSDKCTHLICAFANAPRLRAARAARAPCVAARGEWLEQQARLRRALPWQWFATEKERQVDPPKDYEHQPASPSSECDTDDEIAAVLQKQRKRNHSSDRPSSLKKRKSTDNEYRPPKTETKDQSSNNTKTNEVLSNEATTDVSTDLESDEEKNGLLPVIFDGLRFRIAQDISTVGIDPAYIIRYVKAYGGLVMKDEDEDVDYVLCCEKTKQVGKVVRPDWVWRCHETRTLASTDSFLL